ncbi:MAG: NAD-dependent epimerase/dehydratase family protein [Dehalococcoidales bacterium]|nr:NAD-dependent epimerase/dehydratase family protein [Dehalococcoidales bacterium]
MSGPTANVLITGISGYIGQRLLAGLSSLPEIGLIAGTDIRQPSKSTAKLHFYERSILQPLEDILLENRIDRVVHLAFILKPTHRKKEAGQVDVAGTANLLEACRRAKVRHILYLSSHTVYGALADNPVPLKEDRPFRPPAGFQYAEDKAKAEKILLDFSLACPDIRLTVLRTCPVIGPHAADTISTVMMQMPCMMRLKGHDPPMQFVHEDDVVNLVQSLVVRPVPGVFNVAGSGEIRYSEIARLAGKRMIVIPEKMIRPLLALSWKLHLQSQSPPVGLNFIKYPPLVSTEALETRVNFRFRYSTREAVASFLQRVEL